MDDLADTIRALSRARGGMLPAGLLRARQADPEPTDAEIAAAEETAPRCAECSRRPWRGLDVDGLCDECAGRDDD
jgi:hypothetical protein